MNNITQKLNDFALLVELQTIQRLKDDKLACDANIANARTNVTSGKKYARVDIGRSGRYMVEIATGNIFGIKGYGQVHKGHFYGTLDTMNDYFWGGYYPERLDGTLKTQPANGCPVITTAPEPKPIGEQTVNVDDPNFHKWMKGEVTANDMMRM